MAEMKDRIRQLMESQHMTQQVFAQTLGISSASLSSIFTGRTNPTLKHVEAIKHRFPDINLSWLMFGDGPMQLDTLQDKEQEEEEEGNSVSDVQEPSLNFDEKASVPYSDHSTIPEEFKVDDRPHSRVINGVKFVDKPQRKIREIRVFYDDMSWEAFVPQK
jgi:transcriptional regulator with XRE-family HTH domain